MQYPQYRKELLQLLKIDQREVRRCAQAYKIDPYSSETANLRIQFTASAKKRLEQALVLLNVIGYPTIAAVGSDGSQALSVLALHGRLDQMKKVLVLYEQCERASPGCTHPEALPSLVDRVRICEGRRQVFATQWMLGADGRFFLPPVEDFAKLNERRATHGLPPSRHPVSLAGGVPAHDIPRQMTQETDQRQPTVQEFEDFAHGSVD